MKVIIGFSRPEHGIFGTHHSAGRGNLWAVRGGIALAVATPIFAYYHQIFLTTASFFGAIAVPLIRLATNHPKPTEVALKHALSLAGLEKWDSAPETADEFAQAREAAKLVENLQQAVMSIQEPNDWETQRFYVDQAMKASYASALMHIGWLGTQFEKGEHIKVHLTSGVENGRPLYDFAKLYHMARSWAVPSDIAAHKGASKKLAKGNQANVFYEKGKPQNEWRTLFNCIGHFVRAYMGPETGGSHALQLIYRPDNSKRSFKLVPLDEGPRAMSQFNYFGDKS